MSLTAEMIGLLIAAGVVFIALVVLIFLEWRASRRRVKMLDEFTERFSDSIENLSTNMKQIGVSCEDATTALNELRTKLKEEDTDNG